jgi:signal transduction histidine kinase
MLLESLQRSRSSTKDLAMIDVVIGNLRKGIEDGRRVIRGVRPAVLDDLGLKAAVEDLIDQFSNSPISVTCDCDPQIGRLPDSIQITAYRVIQEALSNAKKHSATDRMHIELKMLAGELCLEIRDFGRGFDVRSARKRGFGLRGMTERVRLLGGECAIESEQGGGTRVLVRLPIQTPNDRKPDALSLALGDS